jgi:hypothetical protein
MSTDNQENKKRYVVWESRKAGTRFMTTYIKTRKYKDNEHHILIAENLSYDDALVLVKVSEAKNIRSFLDDMPAELRTPETDKMITAMIKNNNK